MTTIFFWFAAAATVSSLAQWNWERPWMRPAIADDRADWKNEFEDVCSKTQDAMALSADELRNLVARCDKLKPLIGKLDETQRKVYLKRLQLCRDLLFFVLESKEKK
jgi:hypothetical protein